MHTQFNSDIFQFIQPKYNNYNILSTPESSDKRTHNTIIGVITHTERISVLLLSGARENQREK